MRILNELPLDFTRVRGVRITATHTPPDLDTCPDRLPGSKVLLSAAAQQRITDMAKVEDEIYQPGSLGGAPMAQKMDRVCNMTMAGTMLSVRGRRQSRARPHRRQEPRAARRSTARASCTTRRA